MFLQKAEITLKTLYIVGVTGVCLHIFETSYGEKNGKNQSC